MAKRKPGGGLSGQFENRGQYRDADGNQVKVDTAKGTKLKVRPGTKEFKRVPRLGRATARATYDSD